MGNAAETDQPSAGLGPEERTSEAKAVKRAAIYGTAEAVPFVGQSLPRGSFGAVQIAQPKKSNLDKNEVQPPPFDKLRAGSAGLDFVKGVLTQTLKPVPTFPR